MKSDISIAAWLDRIVVTGCKVGIVLFTPQMAAIKSDLVQSRCVARLAMRSWFSSLLISKGLADVVFVIGLDCQYGNIYEKDEYAVNKIRGEIFQGFAILGVIGCFRH